ncbi:MAG: ABC transporter ATP-binding protein [Nitrospinae bacterium]|nr:ABC transporter ATP-binding protein [Nitrospinota bacterium]
MAKLRIENISHSYGSKEIIDNLSLSAEEGEVACLLGPSGCGKTTLLRLVAGLSSLQSGRICLDEKVVSDPVNGIEMPPENRSVGFMFQDYALFPHLDVLHNITFGLNNPSPEKLAEIQRAMIQMDIVELTNAYPHTLSGGQQQRVALLRALAPLPRLLLLDEPFTGLDISLRVQVREDTLRLIKQMSVTTLMVTHDPQEAMYMADHILIMRNGKVEQVGSPREIYQFPATEFTARFVGQTNILQGIILSNSYDEVMTSIGPVPCLSMRGLEFGTDAFISIRPESFEIDPNGPFGAKVCTIRYVGQSILLEVEIIDEIGKGHRLKMRVPPNLRVDVGEEIKFRIMPDFVTVIEDPLDD